MTRTNKLLVGATFLTVALGGPVFAQGAPQTITIMKVDPQSVATGYRTSKLVGSPVLNEANETVGTIDDLIITPNDNVPHAVLSCRGLPGCRYEVCRREGGRTESERQEDVIARRQQRLIEGASRI
jgi:hypothetical protein